MEKIIGEQPLPIIFKCDIINFVAEEYPSPAEGIGLENRQGLNGSRGFESLLLRHVYYMQMREKLEIVKVILLNGFFYLSFFKNKSLPQNRQAFYYTADGFFMTSAIFLTIGSKLVGSLMMS